MKYRIYRDARGKWIIQNKWTDEAVGFKFATKQDAVAHAKLFGYTISKGR